MRLKPNPNITLKKYFSHNAVNTYVIITLIITVFFFKFSLPFHWMISGTVEFIGFFYFLYYFSRRWNGLIEKDFLINVFAVALLIRSVYVVFSYYFYIYMTGEPFEFSAADVHFYHEMGRELAQLGVENSLDIAEGWGVPISDMGHPIVLGTLYSIFGDIIIIPRFLNALLSSVMCILLYRLSKRNFGELSAKYTAIIAMLLPNFIYYCGLHLKETTMIFLVVLFIERADYALNGEKFKFSSIIVPLLTGFALFLFRTVLGASMWMAFFIALIIAKSKFIGWGKRILLSIWFFLMILFFFSNRIENEISVYWAAREQNQTLNMQSRVTMKDGNSLAAYGSAALFAPVIFIAPFPTIVNVPSQQNQMYMNGSYMVKNVLAFFLFVGFYAIIFKYKTYRRHILLLAAMGAYIGVVVLSAFALSERFHLPAMPFFTIFVGYGLTQVTPRIRQKYVPYLIIIGLFVIAWNIFKLAGRGGF